MTTTILIIVNVFAALAIIVLALMQQSKGDMGSAFGGGGSASMFGSRGSANFLSRMTSLMCAVFFISSLSLAYIYAKRAENSSVVDSTSVLEQVQSSESEVPTIDAVPDQSDPASEVPSLDIPSDDVPEQVETSVDQAVDAVEEAVDSVEEQVESEVQN